MTAVLDASTAINLLVDNPLTDPARNAIRGHDLVAPHIIDLEVTNALCRLERNGQLTADQVAAALKDFTALTIERFPGPALLFDVFSLRRHVHIADAFYVTLARHLNAALITSDARLTRSHALGITLILVT